VHDRSVRAWHVLHASDGTWHVLHACIIFASNIAGYIGEAATRTISRFACISVLHRQQRLVLGRVAMAVHTIRLNAAGIICSSDVIQRQRDTLNHVVTRAIN
jgi:hypothetical protein